MNATKILADADRLGLDGSAVEAALESLPKHTPGPWVLYVDEPTVDPTWHIVTNASRMRVLANVHIEPGNEMDKANALLITAAPVLLAALKAVNRCPGIHTTDQETGETFSEIIAAALKAAGAA